MTKLTDRAVRSAKPGRHRDGVIRGLYLLVRDTGARSWLLRYQLDGRRRDMGLGPYPEVSLADARDKALQARRLFKGRDNPVDPIDQRERRKGKPFRDVAQRLFEAKAPGWGNVKHSQQWWATLEQHVLPRLGAVDVGKIDTRHVLDILRPIWTTKTETASRVRQRIEAVLDYAGAMGQRTGDNPARWKGHLDHLLAKPTKVAPVEHHAALDWREAPALMVELMQQEGAAARALAVTILTAARSGEVRGMRWSEIDLQAKVWTVPASRMKAAKEHRIPLTPAAIALLGSPGKSAGDLVFSSRAGTPLHDTALGRVLEHIGRGDLTVHGFRSTFRDWAGETTSHAREVVEAALAHKLKDKAEAAYARGDLFAKRRQLMADWSTFLSRPPADILPLERAAAI